MTTNERREKIMRILYAKGHCTTSELAENFGVSERTVRRDIGLLSLSKPIYTKSGKNGGGIYIVEGYRIDRNYFSTEEENLLRISAVILVERAGQKKMVIGAGGSRIKRIGTDARIDMEKLFDCKVFLSLFVKVKAGWADDERALKSLGYADFEDK